jgi:hypothetical protein
MQVDLERIRFSSRRPTTSFTFKRRWTLSTFAPRPSRRPTTIVQLQMQVDLERIRFSSRRPTTSFTFKCRFTRFTAQESRLISPDTGLRPLFSGFRIDIFCFPNDLTWCRSFPLFHAAPHRTHHSRVKINFARHDSDALLLDRPGIDIFCLPTT